MTKKVVKLFIIGTISGIVLALFLKLIKIWTGDRAYDLLFDVSYIPLLKKMRPVWPAELLFHFGTCILSFGILYILLAYRQMEKNLIAYIVIIAAGSAALFYLTIFSGNTPAVTDGAAWFYWVTGHFLFSLTGGLLIKKWI